jgi:hypothetical protein
MEWKIDYLEKDNIASVKTFGLADWDLNKQMSEEVLAAGRAKGSRRFLIDQSKIEHGLSLLQVDGIPAMLKQIGVTPDDKVAVVFNPSPQMSNAFKFFRDVSFLEGLAVRIFTKPEEATEWLKSD